ncbi:MULTISPECIES: PAS and ANTAR domain-containing protein [Nocardia]|uniref:PAS and ANTAR domain-containing protein n=1 Tax=Nocardia TaxID=1817 RepID=UPI000D69F8DF|nr:MULTISPECIES: PAS and ANTAR domain-containing protein [Nocardia]
MHENNIKPGAEALAGVTGSFRFWFADQRWEWSDEVAALHGYAPDQVEPTTKLLLSHKHPEDRDEVADTIETVLRIGLPFSSRHRIIDTTGRIHHVLVVGDQLHDPDGTVVGSTGYYVDLTDTIAADRRKTLDAQLPEILASREVIDIAKGVLMAVYGITTEQAFAVLRWRSQETNTKLRVLAERLIAGLSTFGGADTHTRTRLDHLLLTAHETP